MPHQDTELRPNQADSYHFEEFEEGGFLAAVAGGFWGKSENVSVSGKLVSGVVIESVKERISGREPAEVSYFHALDRHLSRQTENCIAGTTLALAYRHSFTGKLIFMTRGDSFIISRPRGGGLEIYPLLALKRKTDELWSCYGDCRNSSSHEMPAEVRHPKTESQLLFLASDGFFPGLRPYGSSREFALIRTATRYMDMLSMGKTLPDIVREAKFRGATDNLTGIVVRL